MVLTKRAKKIQEATHASKDITFDQFVQLLNSPSRLAWLNFYAGFTRGMGGVLGAAVIIVLIGLAVNYLGGIPLLGDLVHKIATAARVKP